VREETKSVVCFYWEAGDREYLPEHVNILARSVREHLSVPHRFVCVYDAEDIAGFDDDVVELVPLPEGAKWTAFLVNPTKPSLPSSYRRLWAFSKEAKCLGDRILQTDIDCLIVGDLLPLFECSDADFVGWRPNSEYILSQHSRRDGVKRIGGGTWLLRTGTHTHIWEKFSVAGIRQAKRHGWRGSDQAWLSYNLAKNCVVFPKDMGIYHTQDTRLWNDEAPEDARIIHFNGKIKSWEEDAHAVKWYCNLMGLPYDPTINTSKVRRMKQARRRWQRIVNPSLQVTFVAFWWGAWPRKKRELGILYVKRLFNSISRFVPDGLDYKFVLFTDEHKTDFGVKNLNVRRLNTPEDLKWNLKKMYMYSKEAKLSGAVICFDLDVVIVGNLKPLIDQVDRMKNKLLLTCRGAYRRSRNRIGGSVIGFMPSQTLTEKLWDPILENQTEIEKMTKGSERKYYQKRLNISRVDFWERLLPGKVLSYKVDHRKKGLSANASVIRFHGSPRPHETKDEMVKKYWR
jgi:hypothetical protein